MAFSQNQVLLSHLLIQTYSFIFRWQHGSFCGVGASYSLSRLRYFYFVRHVVEECNPPPTCSKCTGQSCSVSAYICLTFFHSTSIPQQLHLLPIEWRIQFKLATLTFKTLHTNRPPYLTDLDQYYQPATCHWDLAVSVSLHHISRIHSPSPSAKSSQFLLLGIIWKPTSFSQTFLPPSDPPANVPWFF